MKTTMSFRPTANPRRTRLTSAEEIGGVSVRADQAALEAVSVPRRTANPRRTVLSRLPGEEA